MNPARGGLMLLPLLAVLSFAAAANERGTAMVPAADLRDAALESEVPANS